MPYVWMALGSEGRCEQTLRTDQDNAIIFANVPPERLEGIKNWSLDFDGHVVKRLERCGFLRCPGEVMAFNPRWRQTEQQGQQTFRRWISSPSPCPCAWSPSSSISGTSTPGSISSSFCS
ncbi:hypothetical protein DFAR_2550009 [Desulfarculales bacterium]